MRTFCRILREQWLIRYPKKAFQLTTHEEICQGFQRKKLCFITTAVCAQSGKPDDCPELAAFRSFRDSYLQSQPDGPRLIAQYYDLAPGIVTAIGLMDNPAKVYPFIWDAYLRPCYEALERGKGGSLPEPLYEDGPGAGQKVFARSNLGMSLNDRLPAGFRWVTAIKCGKGLTSPKEAASKESFETAPAPEGFNYFAPLCWGRKIHIARFFRQAIAGSPLVDWECTGRRFESRVLA